MHSTLVPYADQGSDLEAFVAYPNEKENPLVVLCHAWQGRDDFICEKARMIAQLGYVGFALDMYGILGLSAEENQALKQPFVQDRLLLQKRALKGVEAAFQLPYVDTRKVAVIGFGFGGMCALDLARAGIDLKGAVSIYGHFDPPSVSITKPIQAKILVLHGYQDPITPQDELRRFEKEMSEAHVDWQAHIYGNAMHAFATPSARDPATGLLYNPVAAERAWKSVETFLAEIFS